MQKKIIDGHIRMETSFLPSQLQTKETKALYTNELKYIEHKNSKVQRRDHSKSKTFSYS